MKSLKLSLLAAMSLLPLTALPAAPLEVKVDAAKTGAPINPFIYGQFIEHMGRCIYGGIWAEMLEDRKFYFPITAKYAPYRAIENADFPGQVALADHR
jgi:alpha-N-arabinofuranosidase